MPLNPIIRRILGIVSSVVLISCHSPQPQPPLLNSERIQARFGSYSIRVLYQDATWRLSLLNSGHPSNPTCRTVALVRFVVPVAPELTQEHAIIASGKSLGATLKRNGWRVEKEHIDYSEVTLHPTNAMMSAMKLEQSHRLATHRYWITANRNSQRIQYAQILEIHHPDYLSIDDIKRLYFRHRHGSETDERDHIELLTQGTKLLANTRKSAR